MKNSTIILALIFSVFLSTGAYAQKPIVRNNTKVVVKNNKKQGNKWVVLGSKKADFKKDKDVLSFSESRGPFTKLKLVVTKGSLNMHKMVVVYGNGKRDEIEIKQNFTKNSTTRVIDLKGNKRKISKIIFKYDTKNNSKKKATVTVMAKRG